MGQNGMITPKPSAGQDFEILLSPIKKMKNQKNIELSITILNKVAEHGIE